MKNIIYSFALCMFFTSALYSQFSYDNKSIYSDTLKAGSGTSISSCDIDGDNDIDILKSNSYGKILLYENDGTGNFSEKVIFQEQKPIRKLLTTDMDNDGDYDIIFASDKLYLLQNASNGIFNKIILINHIGASADFSEGDIDSDGDLDFFTTREYDGKNVWYKNNGDLTFSTVEFSNYIGDMRLDIMVSNDIDNDGDIDAVSASFIDQRVYLHKNLGNSIVVTEIIFENFSGITSLHVDDIDDDLDSDILVYSRLKGKFMIIENNSNQSFTSKLQLSNMHEIHDIAVSDLDNDNDKDICLIGLDENINILNNIGSGYYNIKHIPLYGNNSSRILVSDINSDGKKDIIALSGEGNKLQLYQNENNLNYRFRLLSKEIIDPISTKDIDFDKDGDFDLVAYCSVMNQITLLENDGNNNFEQISICDTAFDHKNISVGDIDGDGDYDIASSSNYYNRVFWYENIGNNNFITHQISAQIEEPHLVEIADIDGDGFLEVITAAGNLYLHKNLDGKNFTTSEIASLENKVYSINAVDFDGDGDIDIAPFFLDPSYLETYAFKWYENVGGIEFNIKAPAISLYGVTSGEVLDFDNDNDNDNDFDLIVSRLIDYGHYAEYSLQIIENEGDNVFSINRISGNNIIRFNISVGDLDGDGDNDILEGDQWGRLAYFINNGGSQFQYHDFNETGKTKCSDIDMDGDTDVLLLANKEISWLQNKSISTNINTNGEIKLIGYSLKQNYPNPFNPTTIIEYSIEKADNVNLTVYNSLGKKVKTLVNTYKSAGNYKVSFDASVSRRLSSGIYFYTLRSGNFIQTKKMILIK